METWAENQYSRAAFPSTHWTVVLAASRGTQEEAAEAWQELANLYWYPLYAYVRRVGYGPEDAQDLTQEFFERFLEKQTLAHVAPRATRLRSFLLVCLSNFIKEKAKFAKRERRSPPAGLLSLDGIDVEQRYLAEPTDERTPETLFETRCARAVLDLALSRLQEHYRRRGKGELFDCLLKHAVGDPDRVPHAELAAKMNMSHGVVRNEMSLLRQRLARVFRQAVAETVVEKEVETEMRHIVAVLS